MNKLEIIQNNKTITISETFNPLFSRTYSEGIHTLMLEISGTIKELFNIQEQLKVEEIQSILFDGEDILEKGAEDILTMTNSISSTGELSKHLREKDERKKLNITIVFSNIKGE